MAKSQDAKKAVKKEPTKTPKEKKAEKRLKKAGKKWLFFLAIVLQPSLFNKEGCFLYKNTGLINSFKTFFIGLLEKLSVDINCS